MYEDDWRSTWNALDPARRRQILGTLGAFMRYVPPPSRLTQLLWSLAAIVQVVCVTIALLASAGILK